MSKKYTTKTDIYRIIRAINKLRKNTVELLYANTPERRIIWHYMLFGLEQHKYTNDAYEQLRGVKMALQEILPKKPKIEKRKVPWIIQ